MQRRLIMTHQNRIHPVLPILALCLICFMASPDAEAGKRYEFTDLGTLNSSYSKAYEINNSGEIAGFSESEAGDDHAVLWLQDAIIDLTLSENESSRVFGMNDRGVMAGYFYVSSDPWEACIWTLGPSNPVTGEPTIKRTDLGTLGGTYSKAYDVDDAGYQHDLNFSRFQRINVVGWADTAVGERHAFLWTRGEMRDLNTLGGTYSRAYGINNFGQVIGYSETSVGEAHAFLWENGVMSDLSTLGGDFSIAYGINDLGQVVGDSETSGGENHAFLWENGEMYDLGTLGGTTSKAYAINNHEQIVGYSTTGTGERHAFLWENGELRELNDCFSPTVTWVLSEANGINDGGSFATGQIAGIAVSGSVSHAFLIKPVKFAPGTSFLEKMETP